ncbi:MAG: DUF790 family protein [Pyrobaculum sp.]
MIPLELLRVKRRGELVAPLYLRDLKPAEYVLRAYRPGARLKDARKAVEEAPLDSKLARGLAHIVEKYIVVEPVDKKLLTKVRIEVFREAAKAHPILDEAARSRVLSSVAARLKMRMEDVEKALLKVHEDELTIIEAPRITPEELVALYNTSLIQALLFRSRRMSLYVEAGGSQIKELTRALKRLGLMYVAEKRGAGIMMDIDGPASLLKQTERYGTRLAKLVPYVASAGDWRIEAEISLYGRSYRFVESKATAPELSARDPEPLQFDSYVEQEFYAKISQLCQAEREPEALVVDGRIFIPDFKVGELYVEIVGFWTPDYIARKYEKLASAKIPLLVLVDEKLALASWRSLPHYVVVFKERPRLSDVFKYIKPYCRR